MISNVSKQLGLGIAPPTLPAPNLNYQLGLGKNQANGNMLGFDGTYAVPSDATSTGNGTFNKYIEDRKGDVLSLAKRLQADRNSGVYWDTRVLDADINADAIRALSAKAEEQSATQLSTAKKLRQEAIDIENDWNTTAKTARERVDAQINNKARDKKLDDGAYAKVTTLREALIRHAAFKTLRDAYISELEARQDKATKINNALASEDIDKLQEALGLAVTEAQRTALNAKIAFVKESADRKAKIDALTNQLGSATGDQAAAIKAQIDALTQEENIARGNQPDTAKPNLLLYGGIAVGAIVLLLVITRR